MTPEEISRTHMPGEDLHYSSLAEISQLIHKRQISPVELAEEMLERIFSIDPHLNTFITLTPEKALEQAVEIEKQLVAGDDPGILAGVPIAIKDLYETQGILTTAGSPFFQDYIPTADATAVQKLKSSGAVILGKLNMHEIALGITNINPHFGNCHNPWDVSRVPGGSSGGSAAALAAGLCFGSLGSDTGGSIRIPSALCGTAGLKPTRGRVSLKGVIPLSWNMDHAGPMARRVEDLAILLQIIAGYDSADPASIEMLVPDYRQDLSRGVKGLRIAVANDPYFSLVDSEIRTTMQAAAAVFKDLGAHVEEEHLPNAELAFETNICMLLADAVAYHSDRLRLMPEKFGSDVLQRLQTGARTSAAEYSQARRTQAILKRSFLSIFNEWDILVTPTTPTTAPLITGQDSASQAPVLTRFTSMFNLTGLPAISIPCGFSPKTKETPALPIGMQLIARPWDEARLLQAAFAYEQATIWHWQRPDPKPF